MVHGSAGAPEQSQSSPHQPWKTRFATQQGLQEKRLRSAAQRPLDDSNQCPVITLGRYVKGTKLEVFTSALRDSPRLVAMQGCFVWGAGRGCHRAGRKHRAAPSRQRQRGKTHCHKYNNTFALSEAVNSRLHSLKKRLKKRIPVSQSHISTLK